VIAGNKNKIMAAAIITAVIIIFIVALFLFMPRASGSLAFGMTRIKNAFSYYILNARPHFYYLEMEKNGKELRLSSAAALEVTYRDEFVVRSVVSDDWRERYTAVNVEGYASGKNHLNVPLKGIVLVNRVMETGTQSRDAGIAADYYIQIYHRGEKLARVPLRVVITPQDWLRLAKDSTNVRVQIQFLKKALELNKEDTSVRKILAGIYFKLDRLDEAIFYYKESLKLKPDDVFALNELARCYLKKKQYDEAIAVARSVLSINPREAQAHANLGFGLGEKGQWAPAAASYRQAVDLEPDNHVMRFKLGEAYERLNKYAAAIAEYKYIVEKDKNFDAALMALADVSLKTRKYDAAITW